MEKIKTVLLTVTGIVFVAILLFDSYILNSFKDIRNIDTIKLLKMDMDITKDTPDILAKKIANYKDAQELKSKEITNYKEQCNVLIYQKSQLFDMIISKSLLPLFNTLVNGVFLYIFAKLGITSLNSYLTQRLEHKNRSENKK